MLNAVIDNIHSLQGYDDYIVFAAHYYMDGRWPCGFSSSRMFVHLMVKPIRIRSCGYTKRLFLETNVQNSTKIFHSAISSRSISIAGHSWELSGSLRHAAVHFAPSVPQDYIVYRGGPGHNVATTNHRTSDANPNNTRVIHRGKHEPQCMI